MSRPNTLRQINQARVLEKLVEHGALSRADLARKLNLMRSTAGNLVESLEGDHLIRMVQNDMVQNDEKGSARVGRPGIKYELNPQYRYFFVVDIDPQITQIFLFDFSLTTIAQVKIDAHDLYPNPDQFAQAMAHEFETLRLDHKLTHAQLAACFFIVPGLVGKNGNIGYAPSLGWQNINFSEYIKTRLPQSMNLIIENDANAFALCDLANQDNPDETNTIYFWLDDGVGGGLVFDGQLIRGHDGYAGEFGHIYHPTLPSSPHSSLAQSVENIIGRRGLLFQYQQNGGKAENIAEFMEELHANDPIAHQIFCNWTGITAQSIASLSGILNARKVIFGGPLAELAAVGKDQITQKLAHLVLMKEAIPDIAISSASIADVALGCAKIMRRDFISLSHEEIYN